jgi:hypothetical protein
VVQANQQVQSCRALEGTRDRLRRELDALAQQQSLFDELRLALGKNGVPAMVIVSVLVLWPPTPQNQLWKLRSANDTFQTSR